MTTKIKNLETKIANILNIENVNISSNMSALTVYCEYNEDIKTIVEGKLNIKFFKMINSSAGTRMAFKKC